MIQGKRDSKGIFTPDGNLSQKGMTILINMLGEQKKNIRHKNKNNLPKKGEGK